MPLFHEKAMGLAHIGEEMQTDITRASRRIGSRFKITPETVGVTLAGIRTSHSCVVILRNLVRLKSGISGNSERYVAVSKRGDVKCQRSFYGGRRRSCHRWR